MSGQRLRWVGTTTVATAVAAGTLLAPVPASAAPEPEPAASDPAAPDPFASEPATADPALPDPAADAPVDPAAGPPSVTTLLTDLQRLYRESEEAAEKYNATDEQLKKQRATTRTAEKKLAAARDSLHDSRAAAGRMARQQYQGNIELSPYLQLLLARDVQRALDQGHVVRRAAAGRATALSRLTDGERRAGELATKAREALTRKQELATWQKKDRDAVEAKLDEVEELLSGLSTEQLAELRTLEAKETADAQRTLVTSGALSSTRLPSRAGGEALEYAVEQIGKPYVWGAEGPASFDCSGLTSQAWARAGQTIPRTSQEQWATLPKVPLGSLRPGDLVVYFPKATHVAIYLGDGMVVQAPRPGAKVKVSPIAANPLLGAVRPDPAGTALSSYEPPVLPEGADDGEDTGYSAEQAPPG